MDLRDEVAEAIFVYENGEPPDEDELGPSDLAKADAAIEVFRRRIKAMPGTTGHGYLRRHDVLALLRRKGV